MMKRTLALLLALLLALSLCACGGGEDTPPADASPAQTDAAQGGVDAPASEEPPEATATPLQCGDSIDHEQFLMTFDSLELCPEYSYETGEYSSTSIYVEEGYQLVVAKGHFENRGTKAISSYSFVCSATVNDSFTSDNAHINFIRQNSSEIDPYTDLDYILYIQIPQKLADMFETATFTIGFNDDLSSPSRIKTSDGESSIEADNLYTLTGGVSSGEGADGADGADGSGSAGKTIAIGDTVTTDEYEFTLNNVELIYELKPANTNGVYTSYEAESGNIYVHVDGTYHNTSKKDLCIRDLCQPTVDYDNGYTYSGFAVVDKDDNSFTWASSYVVCTPLNSCHYHGLVECPEAVEQSDAPLYVTLELADGETYRYDIR